jgi:hypothetical protein
MSYKLKTTAKILSVVALAVSATAGRSNAQEMDHPCADCGITSSSSLVEPDGGCFDPHQSEPRDVVVPVDCPPPNTPEPDSCDEDKGCGPTAPTPEPKPDAMSPCDPCPVDSGALCMEQPLLIDPFEGPSDLVPFGLWTPWSNFDCLDPAIRFADPPVLIT